MAFIEKNTSGRSKDMMRDSREMIIAFLRQDEIKNMNMLYFMENNPIHHLERIGNSVVLRGKSDQHWVYISSPDEQELHAVVSTLTKREGHWLPFERM